MQGLTESQMNQLLMLTALVSMCGCALGPKPSIGPDGGPVKFIDGMSAAVTYDKATKACPKGYSIVDEPRQTSFIDYEMTVECK
jgi:hypothetical protein